GIRARPDLLKPNREELGRLVGRPIVDDRQLVRAASQLRDRGVADVAVSLGRDGAIAVGSEGVWRAIPPPVEAVSAIGAGDSLVAGLVLALSRGEGLADGLRLGTAAGVATTLRPGTRLARANDIQRLLPLVSVERLTLAKAA
ncbi:MAG: 1-phosphofructokinase family hexose kinase, partial [Chloroflexota bacterium]